MTKGILEKVLSNGNKVEHGYSSQINLEFGSGARTGVGTYPNKDDWKS